MAILGIIILMHVGPFGPAMTPILSEWVNEPPPPVLSKYVQHSTAAVGQLIQYTAFVLWHHGLRRWFDQHFRDKFAISIIV
jgi:hypothetical protein